MKSNEKAPKSRFFNVYLFKVMNIHYANNDFDYCKHYYIDQIIFRERKFQYMYKQWKIKVLTISCCVKIVESLS